MSHHERAVAPQTRPAAGMASSQRSHFQLDVARWYARIAGSNGSQRTTNGSGTQLSATARA